MNANMPILSQKQGSNSVTPLFLQGSNRVTQIQYKCTLLYVVKRKWNCIIFKAWSFDDPTVTMIHVEECFVSDTYHPVHHGCQWARDDVWRSTSQDSQRGH